MNVNNWLTKATARLQQATIASARLDAQVLLSEVMNASKAWLLAHPEAELSAEQLHQADDWLQQRTSQQPIAYLVGHKEFFGRNFIVSKEVLVPRPETEALVELALDLPAKAPKVVDIGTGSGIIGITLALERPHWQITLTDSEATALGIAQQNLHKFALADRVTLRHQDLLQADQTAYSVIIANLPYVPTALRHNRDLQAEPAEALFSGEDGLGHYRRLFSMISKRPSKPTYVITEALRKQQRQLAESAKQYGYRLECSQDLAQLFKKL
jgi:release factor glutamine methyltransferase